MYTLFVAPNLHTGVSSYIHHKHILGAFSVSGPGTGAGHCPQSPTKEGEEKQSENYTVVWQPRGKGTGCKKLGRRRKTLHRKESKVGDGI